MATQVMATLRLPERSWLHVDQDDAKFAINNYASGGTFSGRFKNLAVYSRPLRVLEAQTMTTRVPPTPLGNVDDEKKAQKQEEEESRRRRAQHVSTRKQEDVDPWQGHAILRKVRFVSKGQVGKVAASRV